MIFGTYGINKIIVGINFEHERSMGMILFKKEYIH